MTRRRPTDRLRTFLDQVDAQLEGAIAELAQPLGEVNRAMMRQATRAMLLVVRRFELAHPGVPLERVPVTELVRWARKESEE